MPTPRLLILLVLSGVALVLTTGASAAVADRSPAGGASQLSLVKGKGLATLTSEDGTVIGRIVQGSITFVDYPRGTKTEFNARKWGCEKRRRLDRKTIFCSGRNLHFQIVGGAWLATMRGRGISASAVVVGKVRLRGTRGTFKIDDDARRRWPTVAETFKLG